MVVVNGIFFSTIFVAIVHSVTTGIMCYILGFSFVFTAALLSAFLAVFPIISFYWIFIPGLVTKYWMVQFQCHSFTHPKGRSGGSNTDGSSNSSYGHS